MAFGRLTTPGGLTNAAIGIASVVSGNAKATLTPESGGFPVVFGLNPDSVSVTKQNTTEGRRGVIATTVQDALKGTGNVKWSIAKAHLVGAATTQVSVERLLSWARPVPINAATALELQSATAVSDLISAATPPATSTVPAVGATADISTKTPGVSLSTPAYYRLPILLFNWGLYGPTGPNKRFTLEGVTVSYKRYDDYGIPVWATVDLRLTEYVEGLPFTNPTSGGVPGHNRHVVTQGENVVNIANRAYGSPNAWRAVTEANHIDDPLRVRPGRRLALPPSGNAQEVPVR